MGQGSGRHGFGGESYGGEDGLDARKETLKGRRSAGKEKGVLGVTHGAQEGQISAVGCDDGGAIEVAFLAAVFPVELLHAQLHVVWEVGREKEREGNPIRKTTDALTWKKSWLYVTSVLVNFVLNRTSVTS